MIAELRLRTGTNFNTVTVIPNVSGLSFDAKFGDVGSIQFNLPTATADLIGVKENTVVEVQVNGTVAPNMWYGIVSSQRVTATDGGQVIAFTGASLVSWLDDAIVYPSTWPTKPVQNPDGTITTTIQGHAFENAYAGKIIKDLVDRAVSRGSLSWLTLGFTVTNDSNGQPWSSYLTRSWDNGTGYVAVLQELVNRNMVDFRMEGTTLKMYNYGTMPVQYTPEQVILRRGLQISDQARTVDTSNEKTVVLSVGADAAITESDADSTLLSNIGRRKESFFPQEGITDNTTLKNVANAELVISGHTAVEDTVGVSDNSPKKPWVDFQVGDWVWIDVDGSLKNVQVKQIAASQTDANNLSFGLTLGDRILSKDERTQLYIDNTLGTNGYGAIAVQADKKPPANPSALTATALAFRDSNGVDTAKVTAVWTAPTTNADGTTLRDLDHYEFQYQIGSSTAWHLVSIPAQTTPLAAYVPNLPVGQSFTSRIRAVDWDNNASGWVNQSNTISALPKYTTPPATASTPVNVGGIQSIKIAWDGKDSAGNVVDPSVAYAQIHLSTTSSFTPSTSTQVGTLSAAGTVSVAGLLTGQTYYSKIVIVDKSSNLAVATPASTGVSPTLVQSGDVGFNARSLGGVTTFVQSATPTGAIAGDLWIDSANGNVIKSFDGSVWTARQLDATQIVSGSITASMIVGGTFAGGTFVVGSKLTTATTADGSGPRVDLTSAGLFGWGTDTNTGLDVQNFSVTSDGSISLTGNLSGNVTGASIDSSTVTNTQLIFDSSNTGGVAGASLLGNVIPAPPAPTVINSGSSTTTSPAGATYATVELWAGGGGGGRANMIAVGGTFFLTQGGGAGGGGEYIKFTVPVSALTAYSYSVGAAGAAATSNDGSNGGNTTITIGGYTYTAHGGKGGKGPSSSSDTDNSGGSGGSGGVLPVGSPATGFLHYNGGNGGAGNTDQQFIGTSGTFKAGGGGGGAGAGSNGNGASGKNSTSGTGGSGASGSGGGGNGGAGGNAVNTSGGSTNGSTGNNPGGGGGGASQVYTFPSGAIAATNAAAGNTGRVKITYTIGNPTIAFSAAAVAGSDQYGNNYPAGLRNPHPETTGNIGGYLCYRTWGGQSISSGGTTDVSSMTTQYELSDFGACWSGSPTTWTCPADGFYTIMFQCDNLADNTGRSYIAIRINGVNKFQGNNGTNAGLSGTLQAQCLNYFIAANSTITLRMGQFTSGSMTGLTGNVTIKKEG